MLLLLGILGGLLLAPGATLFLLYRLCTRAFEETKREELQKLVTECAE